MVTTWTARTRPTTNWTGRIKPLIYIAPLQDAYRKVRDQNNEIIYIISSVGKAVPMTNWKARKPI